MHVSNDLQSNVNCWKNNISMRCSSTCRVSIRFKQTPPSTVTYMWIVEFVKWCWKVEIYLQWHPLSLWCSIGEKQTNILWSKVKIIDEDNELCMVHLRFTLAYTLLLKKQSDCLKKSSFFIKQQRCIYNLTINLTVKEPRDVYHQIVLTAL